PPQAFLSVPTAGLSAGLSAGLAPSKCAHTPQNEREWHGQPVECNRVGPNRTAPYGGGIDSYTLPPRSVLIVSHLRDMAVWNRRQSLLPPARRLLRPVAL